MRLGSLGIRPVIGGSSTKLTSKSTPSGAISIGPSTS